MLSMPDFQGKWFIINQTPSALSPPSFPLPHKKTILHQYILTAITHTHNSWIFSVAHMLQVLLPLYLRDDCFVFTFCHLSLAAGGM